MSKRLLDIPQGAIDALKAGVAARTFLSLTFPAAQGGERRWVDAPADATYDGRVWDADTPLVSVGATGAYSEPGMLSFVMDDLSLNWFTLFDLAGERGNDVELHHAVPYGSGDWYALAVFVGKTLRAAKIRPAAGSEDGFRLNVECADEAAYPRNSQAQWTSDGFHRGLALERGLADNSHVQANKARQLIWHRA